MERAKKLGEEGRTRDNGEVSRERERGGRRSSSSSSSRAGRQADEQNRRGETRDMDGLKLLVG